MGAEAAAAVAARRRHLARPEPATAPRSADTPRLPPSDGGTVAVLNSARPIPDLPADRFTILPHFRPFLVFGPTRIIFHAAGSPVPSERASEPPSSFFSFFPAFSPSSSFRAAAALLRAKSDISFFVIFPGGGGLGGREGGREGAREAALLRRRRTNGRRRKLRPLHLSPSAASFLCLISAPLPYNLHEELYYLRGKPIGLNG